MYYEMMVKEAFNNRDEEEIKEDVLEIKMHGQFEKNKQNVKNNTVSWVQVELRDLKRTTESQIITAQDQVLASKSVKYNICKISDTQKFGSCWEECGKGKCLWESCTKGTQPPPR